MARHQCTERQFLLDNVPPARQTDDCLLVKNVFKWQSDQFQHVTGRRHCSNGFLCPTHTVVLEPLSARTALPQCLSPFLMSELSWSATVSIF